MHFVGKAISYKDTVQHISSERTYNFIKVEDIKHAK